MTETEFPARDCHMTEHAAVIASVREVRALVEAGNANIARSLAAELARWFPGHADYLDSALAHWMFKRLHGGKPIVLRRGVAANAEAGERPLDIGRSGAIMSDEVDRQRRLPLETEPGDDLS